MGISTKWQQSSIDISSYKCTFPLKLYVKCIKMYTHVQGRPGRGDDPYSNI